MSETMTHDETEIEPRVVNESVNTDAEENEDEFDFQSVEKCYYPPDQRDAAQEYMNKVLAVAPEKSVRNNFPENDVSNIGNDYGLAIIPVGATIKDKGRVTKSVLFAAIPSFEAIVDNEKGEEFIRDTVTDACLSKVANAARQPNNRTLPYEIRDFFERRKMSESLETYNLLQKPIVKNLKDQGFHGMTKAFLRQCLSSAKIAEQAFPKVSQENWEKLLALFMKRAESYVDPETEQPKPLDPEIFKDWLAHRAEEEEESSVLETVDFAALENAA